MIKVILQISEINGKMEVRSSGGNIGKTSAMERDFAKKFLSHINRFNSVYEKLHSGNHIRMRVKRKRRSQ